MASPHSLYIAPAGAHHFLTLPSSPHIVLGILRKSDSLPGETWLGSSGQGSTHKQFYGSRAGKAGQGKLGWAEMAQALFPGGPSSMNYFTF